MSVSISPVFGAGVQLFTSGATPLSGGLINTYLAGSSTPAATYTDSTGATPNPVQIVLDSAGRAPNEIWLTDGVSYKFVVTDSLGANTLSYDGISNITGTARQGIFAGIPLSGITNLTTTGNTVLGAAQANTLNIGNGDIVKDANGNIGLGTGANVIQAKLNLRQDSGDGPMLMLENRVVNAAVHKFGSLVFSPLRDIADPVYGAAIWAEGTSPGAYSADLVFGTSVSSAASVFPTERLRMLSTGDMVARGMPVSRGKIGTTTRASTVTIIDDPDLIVPLQIGTYSVELWAPIWSTTGSGGGLQFRVAFSGTSTSAVFSTTVEGVTVNGSVLGTITTEPSLIIAAGVAGSGVMTIKGSITVTVAGYISMQWAQNSSNVNPANVGIGAWMNCTKVA